MENYSGKLRKELSPKSSKNLDSSKANRGASFADSEIYINRTMEGSSTSFHCLQNTDELSEEINRSIYSKMHHEDPAKADSEQLRLSLYYKTPSMESYSSKPRNDLSAKSFEKPTSLQKSLPDSEIYLRRIKGRSNISTNTSDAALENEKFKQQSTIIDDRTKNKNLIEQKSTCRTFQITSDSEYHQFYKSTYQRGVPSSMRTAFDKPSLTREIWSLYSSTKLSAGKHNSYLLVSSKLTDIITASLRGSSLLLMGSVLSGLADSDSYFDVNVVLPEEYDGHVTSSISEIRIHRAIRILLCSLSKDKNIRNISISETRNSKMRIVFEITEKKGTFGQYVDLTVNDSNGMKSTQLIYLYTQCDWRFQPLYNFIKRWALCQYFHGKTESLLSSYSIAIMVIYFLQKGVEPVVLPVLHELKTVKFQSNCNEPVNLGESRNIHWKSCNNMLLGELTERFFQFYTVFNYKEIKISIRTSKPLQVPTNRNSEDTGIFIEEPFSLANTIISRTGRLMVNEITAAMYIASNLIKQGKSLNTLLLNYSHEIINGNLHLIE